MQGDLGGPGTERKGRWMGSARQEGRRLILTGVRNLLYDVLCPGRVISGECTHTRTHAHHEVNLTL